MLFLKKVNVRLLFLITLTVWSMSQASRANEDAHGGGGGTEAPAHGEAAAHGEASAHGEVKKVEEAPGWIEVETQISSLEAKLQSKTLTLKTLIEEKNHLKENDKQLGKLVQEIGKTDKERRQLAEDLEKQKTILRFRFPERGASGHRKYQKIELKSVNEIESTLGVDGRLDRSMKKMRSQFGSETNSNKKKNESEKPHAPVESEGAIILQK